MKRYTLTKVNAAFANCVRRVLLSEIPTQAIESICVLDNTSQYEDQYIAHRLGLVPLLSGNNDAADLVLEAVGPAMVTSGDLRVAANAPDKACGEDVIMSNSITPVHSDLPILRLMPGETLSLIARVASGTGAMHAKWSPVAVVEYKIVPSIAIDNSKFQSVEDLEDVVYSCPKEIFEIQQQHNEIPALLVAARPADCTMCKECLKNAPPGALTIDPMHSPSAEVDIRMAIEPIGQLSVDACVAEAFAIIEEKLHCIAEYLDSVASGQIDMVEIGKIYK